MEKKSEKRSSICFIKILLIFKRNNNGLMKILFNEILLFGIEHLINLINKNIKIRTKRQFSFSSTLMPQSYNNQIIFGNYNHILLQNTAHRKNFLPHKITQPKPVAVFRTLRKTGRDGFRYKCRIQNLFAIPFAIIFI